LSALVVGGIAVPIRLTKLTEDESLLWDRFKQTYGRVFFDSKDEGYRKTIFVSNLRKIAKHNEEHAQGWHTFTLAMNEFGDLTNEEFFAKYTGYRGQSNEYLRTKNTANLSDVQVAADIDWVAKGAVTVVKNQGQCGSCWAFSSTGAIEGAWFIKKGQLVSLSEQQLMDCSKSEGNESCEGGLMDQAFEYVIKNKGICSEADVPYKAVDQTKCPTCTVKATISGYTDVGKTEADLLAAVNLQPVAVAIEADQDSFQFYSSGVLTGACGTQLDHGVLAVGYGELDGTKYWKVKNSWGKTWGMDGYILIQRNKAQSGGQCGIHMAASYPTV
jgi:cathepsin L